MFHFRVYRYAYLYGWYRRKKNGVQTRVIIDSNNIFVFCIMYLRDFTMTRSLAVINVLTFVFHFSIFRANPDNLTQYKYLQFIILKMNLRSPSGFLIFIFTFGCTTETLNTTHSRPNHCGNGPIASERLNC